MVLILTSCVSHIVAPISPTGTTPIPTETKTIHTPIPTYTPAPESTATAIFQLTDPGKTIVFDFTTTLCEAAWMNSIRGGLSCPGDINNPFDGYVGLLSGSDQGLDSNYPIILLMPASRNAGGIFGRFASFKVGPEDEFRASLACKTNSNCDVEFTLGYYDENGKYQEPFPVEHYRQASEPPINYVVTLGGLSGRDLDFVLVVRAAYQSDPLAAWALWIHPRIVR